MEEISEELNPVIMLQIDSEIECKPACWLLGFVEKFI